MENLAPLEQSRLDINWKNLFIVMTFHVLSVVALFYFSWTNLVIMLVGNWIVGSLGVGLGYHRLLTHRSFKAPKWLEYTLTALGTMSMQDAPDKWVATHRIHHAYTEMPRDPHTTRPSFWWAHIGWVVLGKAQDHDAATSKRYIPDLLKDRFYVLLAKYYLVPIILSGVLLYAFGGWSAFSCASSAGIRPGWSIRWRFFRESVR